MPTRQRVPKNIQRELRGYFRDTRRTIGMVSCVVTEREDFTWHHLNHDPNDHRLSNLVPLIQDLNKNLDSGRSNSGHINGRLRCEELENTADTAFWMDGQVARAYGCSRIAFYVAEYSRRPLSFRLECARRSLYYARHRTNFEILEELHNDTVLDLLSTATDKQLCPEVIRSTLQELEALLTLGGESAEALRLHRHVQKVKLPSDEYKHASALRRKAQTVGIERGPLCQHN